MATWYKDLPAGYGILFEVIGKEAGWRQFGRVKAEHHGEKMLNDSIGARVMLKPSLHKSKVYFTPYHDSGGSVGESRLREVPGSAPDVWILRCEDSSDGDYNDYVVRASRVHQDAAVSLDLIPAS